MDFTLSPEQEQVRALVARVCADFGDDYWRRNDSEVGFPEEFYRAVASAGLLGIGMPGCFGGSGLGITEAAIMMREVAESGAAMAGASSIHMNIFGLQPAVVFGTDEQKPRMLPPLIRGEHRACFAVTEPDAGLNTTELTTRAERTNAGWAIHGQIAPVSSHMILNYIGEKVLGLDRSY